MVFLILDYNDIVMSKYGGGHHSDDIAAVLSPAEVAHGSGQDVITATVLAYEVNSHFPDKLSLQSKGWDGTVFGVIACGVAAAKAFGLKREQIGQAVNLSVTPNSGLYQTRSHPTPDLATFANGVMIRYLDYNDIVMSKYGGGHHSDDIAAVLSPAEVAHGSGQDVITATVLAYEVNSHFPDKLSLQSKGWDGTVFGVIACGVAAAKAFGLKREQIGQAVNLSVTPNNGLYQTRIGAVSFWKGVAMPNAARDGVFAAMLAGKSMTWPRAC